MILDRLGHSNATDVIGMRLRSPQSLDSVLVSGRTASGVVGLSPLD